MVKNIVFDLTASQAKAIINLEMAVGDDKVMQDFEP
jgi:hypothetical protein